MKLAEFSWSPDVTCALDNALTSRPFDPPGRMFDAVAEQEGLDWLEHFVRGKSFSPAIASPTEEEEPIPRIPVFRGQEVRALPELLHLIQTLKAQRVGHYAGIELERFVGPWLFRFAPPLRGRGDLRDPNRPPSQSVHLWVLVLVYSPQVRRGWPGPGPDAEGFNVEAFVMPDGLPLDERDVDQLRSEPLPGAPSLDGLMALLESLDSAALPTALWERWWQ